MKMRYVWCFLIFFLLFFSCGEDEAAIKVDLDKREQIIIKDEIGVITYAYLPQYSHTESYRRHHPLIEYLRKETGLNIKQIFPDTFDQHMKMVGQGKIDISFSNPFIYVKIADNYHANAFARIIEDGGKHTFSGQIICRNDNLSIQTLSDCRQKKWIAVDPTSAGGYLYPLGHFIDNGIFPQDFKEIAFAPGPGGKQEKVILSVYAGKYDIGTIREGALDVVSGKIDISRIRVLAHTAPYPGWVYAARKDLNKSIVLKLTTAFENLDVNRENHRQILLTANFTDVIGAVDSDFDQVRQLVKKLGVRTADK